MPPRTVRRPSIATPLKKRPHAAIPVEPEEPEEQEEEQVDYNNNNNHQHSPKEEKEEVVPVEMEVQENDRSERLELEDNYYHEEVEDDGAANADMEEYQDDREAEEDVEYDDEERVDGDEMMGGIMEGEEADGEEHADGHGEGVNAEEEEHHNVMKERRKRKEFEIFVGGLDRDATDEDLRKVFSEVGEVTEVRLLRNPLTHKNKGFAFLRFATVEQARRAVNELKHPMVNGKQCGVSPSQDSDTLFVGNICKTWTKAVLKETLVQYGVDNFEDLTLVEDAKNEGLNRGFAFLDFSCRDDALDACKRLQKMDVVFGTDRTAKVAFADTFIEPDDEIMAQVKTVFLDGIPASWDEERVTEHVKKFGNVEKVELARNMPAAKRTDFGFVTFDTHEAAVGCVEGINNNELSDGEKKLKVRARLSRPRQRGKSSRYARGGYIVGRGGGRGGRSSWGYSGSHTESWRYESRSGRGIQSRRPYAEGFRQSLGQRDRYTDVAPRVESRRRVPSSERYYDRSRSPGLPYSRGSSKREYVRSNEHYPRSSGFVSGARSSDFISKTRSSDFATKAPAERRWSHRDAYPSREPEYLDSPPRSAPRVAARRPPPSYAEDSYGRHVERPSGYRTSQSHDYASLSGSKRPHSSLDEYQPRFSESTLRQPRARFDYEVNNDDMSYNERAYGAEPTTSRPGRGSHLGYDRGSRGSAGHSHGQYGTHSSSTGYGRDEVRRGDIGGTYSSYDRDYPSRAYTSTETDMDPDSYSSLYSNRRMGDDAYASRRGSGTYY